nr:Chain C, Syndecan-1 [Homo sapiens]4GVD_D Chain D, Syndecan-1 [Homo sapiens]
TKQEEFYA